MVGSQDTPSDGEFPEGAWGVYQKDAEGVSNIFLPYIKLKHSN